MSSSPTGSIDDESNCKREREAGRLSVLHPADQLASALLGASAEAQIELPNGSSLRMDRRAIRKLRQSDESTLKE
jgi:hypothetical protein